MPLDPKAQMPYYNIDETLPTPPINPNISGIYRAKLTQSGTNDPVATEDINNTITGIVWTRSVTGIYIGTLTGTFPLDKTYINLQMSSGNTGLSYQQNTVNTVTLLTWGVNGIAQDNIIQVAYITITILN